MSIEFTQGFSFLTKLPDNGSEEARRYRTIILKAIWQKRSDLKRYVARIGPTNPLEIHLHVKGSGLERNEESCKKEITEFLRLAGIQ